MIFYFGANQPAVGYQDARYIVKEHLALAVRFRCLVFAILREVEAMLWRFLPEDARQAAQKQAGDDTLDPQGCK